MRLAAHAPRARTVLNIGGGFGIPYFPGEQALDLAADRRQPATPGSEARTASCRKRGWSSSSGASWSARQASTCARASTSKISRGRCSWSPTAACITTCPPPGNFGQVHAQKLSRAYRQSDGPARSRDRVGRRPPVHAAGPAGRPHGSGPAEAGDLVVVFMSGAYGYTASPTRFLSHPEPTEHLARSVGVYTRTGPGLLSASQLVEYTTYCGRPALWRTSCIGMLAERAGIIGPGP